MSSPPSLDERIQALAQELQDIIFDYTVAFEPGVVIIDEKWKAPWQLQINRATRAKLNKAYYSRATFSVKRKGGSLWAFPRWIRALDQEQREMISNLRVDAAWRDEILPTGLDLRDVQREARHSLNSVQACIDYKGTRLPNCKVKAKILVSEVNGDLKEVWRGVSDWPGFTDPTWVPCSRYIVQDLDTEGQQRVRLSQICDQIYMQHGFTATELEAFRAEEVMEANTQKAMI